MVEKDEWTHIIKSKSSWLNIKLSQLWSFRDLIFLFVKRDFTATYKQTILGPLWHFLQPIISSFIFTFAFSFIAKISTENIPPVLFYLSGIVPWSYFAECTTRTSNTFVQNAGIFGKVFFPRMVVPVSSVLSNLIRFSVQFCLFLIFFFVYYLKGNVAIHPNYFILLFPVLIITMAFLGLGIGMIVSSLTIRYRDLSNLVGFGVQLLLYLSPVIFPVSIWPEKIRWIIFANPMTSIIEIFRYGFLGIGSFNLTSLLYSMCVAVVLLLTGIIIFNRVEKNFIDTI
ncbi:MAG: ABC transporter permease [Bacteroidetes bacterium]|nr:ABC transporter permease [Bacteroidota bacterium]